MAKRDRRKKPGLMFKALSIEIETVTNRMKKPCDECGALLKTGGRRVKLAIGTGRYAKNAVLCSDHGYALIKRLRQKCEVAMAFIGDKDAEKPDGDIRVRMPGE